MANLGYHNYSDGGFIQEVREGARGVNARVVFDSPWEPILLYPCLISVWPGDFKCGSLFVLNIFTTIALQYCIFLLNSACEL